MMRRIPPLCSLLVSASLLLGALPAAAETVFMVQLGSFRTDAEAAQHWTELSRKFPDLFGPLTYAPAEVTLPPDDAIYHRTQAGPISTRADAERICARVVQDRQECYVVETAMFGGDSRTVENEAAPAEAAPPPSAAEMAFEANVAPVAVPVYPVTAPVATPVASAAPVAASPFGAPTPLPSTAAPAQMSQPAPVPQPMPAPIPGVVPAADVHVAEAIPVPLSDPRLSGQTSPYGDGFRGTPGSYNRFMPFWAEIGYFDSQRGALGYWSVLRTRDVLIPANLRLRITQPFKQRALAEKLSLRVGPFTSVEPVRRLCALTRPERLGCRAVRDLGGSIAYQPSTGAQGGRGLRQNPYMLRRAGAGAAPMVRQASVTPAAASPFGAPTPPGGGTGGTRAASAASSYWVQLGSFMVSQSAQDKWSDLKAKYPALSRYKEQVYAAPGGALWRLRTGPFATSPQAASLCGRLKAIGELCSVTAE